MPINAITKENGKAPMIIAVLIADRPPARSNTAITNVNADPQVMIWTLPFCEASPPAAIVLMIRTAESADVTRKVSNRTTMMTDIAVASAGDSMMFIISNSCDEIPASIIWPPAIPRSSKSMVVPPTKVNHTKHMVAGTIMAPSTYSRMLLPREMRAKNSPTKGAKAIHHAQ